MNRRRTIKRAALLLGVPVLLLSWYMSAWLTVSRAAHQGFISAATATEVAPAFKPILAYCSAGHPGAKSLKRVWWALNPLQEVDRGNLRIRIDRHVPALAPSRRILVSGFWPSRPGLRLADAPSLGKRELSRD